MILEPSDEFIIRIFLLNRYEKNLRVRFLLLSFMFKHIEKNDLSDVILTFCFLALAACAAGNRCQE